MSKQVVQALEDSLQDGTFSEVSQGAIEAHLTGEQTLSFSRLRRFLLGDSLSTDQVEQVLEPLIVHSEQAHRYTDLALLRLGPSRTLDILCRRQMPTRFRGVIEFLRKSDKLPTDQAAWIAARLVQALGRGGASLEAFELLELVSLCGNVSSEDADRVVESLPLEATPMQSHGMCGAAVTERQSGNASRDSNVTLPQHRRVHMARFSI